MLYDARVIIEYLDERFPHPPLMPVDPVLRAQFRLALYRIERDWYGLAEQIERETGPQERRRGSRRSCATRSLQSAELFKIKPFFLSDEFSLVDATIAPMLWRMRRYGIELPPQAQAIAQYAASIMARPSFRASLSDVELEMGVPMVAAQPRRRRAAPQPVAPALPAARDARMDGRCGFTPHMIVDASRRGVEVPAAYVKDGKIVLNVSLQRHAAAAVCATSGIEFDARFAGVVHHVRVPMRAVLGIYARETGEGMVFNENEPEPPPAGTAGAAGATPRVVTAVKPAPEQAAAVARRYK